jgi:hypothetical protein
VTYFILSSVFVGLMLGPYMTEQNGVAELEIRKVVELKILDVSVS